MQEGLLPLFPLQVVLFPGTLLPLHIFEDRYKEMISEAIRDQSEFGVVLATGKGVADQGCSAVLDRVLKEYPDGRMDILAIGRRRFEILLINEERAFLRGSVDFFVDADSIPSSDELRAVTAAYNLLMSIEGHPPLDPAVAIERQLSFRLAQPVNDLDFRQSILKVRNEAERIHMLAGFLPGYAASRKSAARLREVAPQNGHGHLRHE